MITERHEELAALHVLGLLEGEERSAFERELAGNAELQRLVAELTENAATLALAAPQVAPPASLKESVLAAADAAPASTGATVVTFPFMRWLPYAAAACFGIAALWLAALNLALRSENTALRTERELAEIAYHTAQNQLKERTLVAESLINQLGRQLRDQEDLTRLKVTALASLAGNTKEAQVIAVWDPRQETGLLTFDQLPAIEENQDYQIWVVDPAYKNPVNGGVFHVSAGGKAALSFKPDQPVKQAAAFAISLEKKGGVAKAEGPIVLLGK
ncbi:MAG: anti-sigma factor [Opitutae bacterium]|nr:anti-sigma factor [Opitutae bacterium]